MANVPPEYEDAIKQAQAELAKVTTQKTPSQVLAIIKKQLFEMVSAADTSELKDPSVLSYVAFNLMKVFARVQGLAKKYPPTKRKGVGKDGGIEVIQQEEWMWTFSGAGGGGGGGGEDTGDDGEDQGGTFDFAPSSEISRAQAMLQTVAAETDFGYGDDPLTFVREVAKRLGGRWGLNGKRGNPNDPSKDVLAWDIPGYLPQLFDVLGDAGGDNKIYWGPLRYGQPSVWIAP